MVGWKRAIGVLVGAGIVFVGGLLYSNLDYTHDGATKDRRLMVSERVKFSDLSQEDKGSFTEVLLADQKRLRRPSTERN